MKRLEFFILFLPPASPTRLHEFFVFHMPVGVFTLRHNQPVDVITDDFHGILIFRTTSQRRRVLIHT